MQSFLYALTGNAIIGIGIIFTLFLAKKILDKLINKLVFVIAFTVGLLLGIIFLGFIPKVADNLPGFQVGAWILIGIFVFYVLELFLHWHHCRDLNNKGNTYKYYLEKAHKSGFLMFGGTLLHNAFHGVILFGAFSVSVSFGIATTLAVLLHSIPQNVVNFVMNKHQEKFAYLAAIGGIFGAILTYPFKDFLLKNKFYILALIAGGLLYTSLADIFPEIKEKGNTTYKLVNLLIIFTGIGAFILIEYLSKQI